MLKLLLLTIVTGVMLTALVDWPAPSALRTEPYGSGSARLEQASGQEPALTAPDGDDQAQALPVIVALGAGFVLVTGGAAYSRRRPRGRQGQ